MACDIDSCDPMTNLDGLGRCRPVVEDELARLRDLDAIGRIWRGDHTLWKPSPDEITDRLGWLSLPTDMGSHVADFVSFADEVARDGYTHVVSAGHGRKQPGARDAAPGLSAPRPGALSLWSSTPRRRGGSGPLPAASTRPAPCFSCLPSLERPSSPTFSTATSGDLVDGAVGRDRAGRSFAAVTDPGTALEVLASGDGFRRVFQVAIPR